MFHFMQGVKSMAEDLILKCIPIRSDDRDNRRLCDLVIGVDGHLYIIDVENDQKHGKKKYTSCIDAYVTELYKAIPVDSQGKRVG